MGYSKSCLVGWWFGTWISFFHILGIMIPIDFYIFQRIETTNQITNCIDTWLNACLRFSKSRLSSGGPSGRTRRTQWLRALLWAAAAGNGGKVWAFLEPSLVSWKSTGKEMNRNLFMGYKKNMVSYTLSFKSKKMTLECSTGGSWNNSGFPYESFKQPNHTVFFLI